MTLATSLNPFGLGLFRCLSASSRDTNVVISPLSLKICLSMAACGATKGSATEKEMMALLRDISAIKVDAAMDVANSAWVNLQVGGINADYVRRIKQDFGAEVFPLVDVKPEPINKHVKESTHGRIEKLFEELDPLTTVMVLVNTVFFRGSWAQRFDSRETRKSFFRHFGGESSPCNMMYKEDKQMMFTRLEQVSAVRLPYASQGLFATILLPHADGPEALEDAVGSLTPESWAIADKELRSRRKHVELRMPRFNVMSGESLVSALQQLGMPTPFEGEEDGAFLGMSEDPTVYISEIMHKATIEVNEVGTIAAAATGVEMRRRLSVAPPVTLVTIDRPFLFLISDSDGAILFLAKALSPNLSGIGATFSHSCCLLQ